MSTTVTYKGNTLTTATNQTRTLKTSGKYLEDDITVVDVTEASPTMQAKTNINPTTSSQTITPDNGYDGLSSVQINAMPSGSATPAASISATGASITAGTNTLTLSKTVSNTPQVSAGYVSSGTAGNSAVSLTASVNTRSSSDLTASGATVTAPAGYYESAASKSVASGTEGTPTASKGTVSNHAISVTPSVTNSAGYISGGTKTGTAVSVSASELVSGTLNVTSSGTKDVTNYASASIPAGTAGTPTATKGTVSNHAVTVTPSVTNQTGFITGSTINGTGVSVSASELVSGTVNITASGNTDVTNYATASVASLTLPHDPSSTSSGTKISNVSASDSTWYLNIPSGFNNTAKYYEIPSLNTVAPTDTISITENGTYDAEDYDCYGFSSVTVNVSGGSGSSMQVGYTTKSLATQSYSISFTGLNGTPTAFTIIGNADLAVGTPSKVAAVVYDGINIFGQLITNTSNAQASYDGSGFSYTYNSGTLTVTSANAVFVGDDEYLIWYTYGGTAANIHTSDVQVGSGATSITFSGLEDEPEVWSVVFKSNFSTSSGYQRVVAVADWDGIGGYALDSTAHKYGGSVWTASYNNGSFTLTSQGTNAGGYFHQPGYYQLTYGISGDQSMQTKTVTPTTSVQNVTADTGYTGLKKVVVNAIPSSYVQPTSTVGSTTYRASTSNQTINAGTYHSAAATIAAVSQTNLEAGNIKSGTTISISNGQSNIWSVTGTYTGGGGGANFGTVTMTNSSNQAQSIDFTLPSGRTPKAFFARLTTQITRNSNSRYYYVENMRWDGSATGGVAGRCFYMSSGQLTNITSGYSYSQSGTTFTLSSTGSRSASPGSFYNGQYELVYVY